MSSALTSLATAASSGASRRAMVSVTYANTDITAQIQPNLISLRAKDELDKKADDLEIELQDSSRIWIGSWAIQRGQVIQVSITQLNWTYPGETVVSSLGSFQVTDTGFKVSKHGGCVTTIKASSIYVSSTAKTTQKDKAYENTNLQNICSQICAQNGLTLNYLANVNPTYSRKDQVQESDLEFLKKLVRGEGLLLKITNNILQVADEQTMEAQAPVATITFGNGIISGDFNATCNRVHKKCTLTNTNPLSGACTTGQYTPASPPPVANELNIREYVNYAAADSPADDSFS